MRADRPAGRATGRPSGQASSRPARQAKGRPAGRAGDRSPRPAGPAGKRPGGRSLVPARVPLWLALAATAVALPTLVVALLYSEALQPVVPTLRQAGPVTTWGLPIAKLVMNAAGTITIGWLLMAVVFVPASAPRAGGPETLSLSGQRSLRAVSLSAVVWGLSALVLAAFSISNLLGRPLLEVIYAGHLIGFFVDLPEGRALLVIAIVAAVLSVGAHLPRSSLGAGPLLILALLGITPTIFTGHAASSSSHALAVFSLGIHIIGAAAWVGGLIVMILMAARLGERLPQVVSRFSTLALLCFLAVGTSGAVNAYVRLGGLNLETEYARLVVAKAVALVLLGLIGLWHRRASIPALRTRRRGRVFTRIAVAEVAIMAATIALATGLSRTPPPLVGAPGGHALLGFNVPPAPSLRTFSVLWWVDPLFVVLVAAGAVLYAFGLFRLRRARIRWPLTRTLAWYGGLAIVLAATSSGLARYSMVIFSAHMAQHLLISALAPIPLLLGAPVTLGLRAARSAPVVGRSPRALLEGIVGGRFAKVLANPLVAFPAFAASMYGFYLTPLFEITLADHAFHSLSMTVFLASGVLFLWPILCAEGSPYRLDMTVRFALLLAVMPVHAFFGLGFASTQEVFAQSWFRRIPAPWAPPLLLDDQQFAGVLAWSIGIGTAVLALLVLAYQYFRARTGGAGARAGAAPETPSEPADGKAAATTTAADADTADEAGTADGAGTAAGGTAGNGDGAAVAAPDPSAEDAERERAGADEPAGDAAG